MFKKIILLAAISFAISKSYAQNEIGGFLLNSITGIYNSSDSEEDFYNNRFTMSKGFGINFIHFYKGKKDTRKHSRYGYRIDLIYQGQSQKWTANYKVAKNQFVEHKGQIRLDYIKLAPSFEVSHPYTKHLSLIFFAGPQISYLIDNDGGLLNYRQGETFDHFDLPAQNKDYYRSFTLDATFGLGADFEFTKWLNLTGGFRGDFSITGMDKPNKEIDGVRLYNLDRNDRPASRNFSISLFLGVEYTLHRPEHAKTRF